MIEEKSWREFRDIGLFWFINTVLHMFGWALVYETDGADSKAVSRVYPARTKYRGFSEDINSDGYRKVSMYLKQNIEEICAEASDDTIK